MATKGKRTTGGRSSGTGSGSPPGRTGSGPWREAKGGRAEIVEWGERPGLEVVGVLKGKHAATTRYGERTVYDVRDPAAKRSYAVMCPPGELDRKLDEVLEEGGAGCAVMIRFERWEKGKGGQRRRVFYVAWQPVEAE